MDKNIAVRIEDFGPIKGPEIIYIRPFMIFSGSSGLGKSYVAMLIHFVYRVLCGDETLRFLQSNNVDFDQLKINLSKEGEDVICKIKVEDFIIWLNKRAVTYMANMLGNSHFNANINILLPDLPEYFTFLYSRNAVMTKDDEMNYVETLRFIEGKGSLQFPQLSTGTWGHFPFLILIKQYFRTKYDLLPNRTFFMPPSRGSYIAIPDDLRLRMGGRETIAMYKEFLDDLSTLKTSKMNNNITKGAQTAIKTMQSEILHGSIGIKDNDIIYRINDTLEIPITAAASSIKELSPFAIMVNKGVLNQYSILFEEPESHLHPELQLKVAELIAYSLEEGSHLQITTHSDYLLRHINDLIRLHVLRNELKDDNLYSEICSTVGYEPDVTINPDNISALYFDKNSEGHSYVKMQDLEYGIPFDTFDKVNNSQLEKSSKLYDLLEFYKSRN